MVLMVILYGVMLLGAVVYIAAPGLWFSFRWRVLGWKPEILVEKVAKKTVADCAPAAIDELDGNEVAGEEKRQRIERLFQEVILQYAKNFSVYLSEGPDEEEKT